jgi:hypothetical protein
MNCDWNTVETAADIQINETHIAVQFYTQVQRK